MTGGLEFLISSIPYFCKGWYLIRWYSFSQVFEIVLIIHCLIIYLFEHPLLERQKKTYSLLLLPQVLWQPHLPARSTISLDKQGGLTVQIYVLDRAHGKWSGATEGKMKWGTRVLSWWIMFWVCTSKFNFQLWLDMSCERVSVLAPAASFHRCTQICYLWRGFIGSKGLLWMIEGCLEIVGIDREKCWDCHPLYIKVYEKVRGLEMEAHWQLILLIYFWKAPAQLFIILIS